VDGILSHAKEGSWDVVSAALHRGFPVNEGDSSRGQPLLHVVVSRAHLPTLAMALALGADPNSMDRYGETAMHIAATGKGSSAPVLRALLDAGADVNGGPVLRQTPLIQLVRFGGVPSEGDVEARAALLLAHPSINLSIQYLDLTAEQWARARVGRAWLAEAIVEVRWGRDAVPCCHHL
jgi:ankyrin repeat protein